MIKLYQYYTCWDMPNPSPFCMKMETYLRMTALPFEIVRVSDPRKSPKGKLPYIDDDGTIVADSGLIITYLARKHGDRLDSRLTDAQKAQALAWQRLIEEHLYWAIVYSRWIDPGNWPLVRKTFFGRLPVYLRKIIAAIIRKKVRKQLYDHGIGRHRWDEIYHLGVEDLKALSITLDNNQFFMGEEASSIDACVYAFLASILYAPVESPLKQYVSGQENFVAYCARMKDRYYADQP